jgi:hypothetical protein
MRLRAVFSANLVLALMFAGAANGQDVRTEPVVFDPDGSAVTVEGVIEGYHIVDYTLEAEAGATLCVRLQTDHTANYFNVLPPGSEEAIFIGSVSGGEWTGALPVDGEYRVRVYLMRSAARRNESADYALRLMVGGASNAGAACRIPAAAVTGSGTG